MAGPSRVYHRFAAACGWVALHLAITPLAFADEPAAQPSPSNVIVEQAVEQNFLVFSVTTDLQRVLAGYVPRKGETLKAFVALNGTSLQHEEGQFVPNALNVDAIRRSLAPFKDAEHGVVEFSNLDSRERIQFRIKAPNIDAARKARDGFREKESRRLAVAVGFKNWTTFLGSYED